MNSSSKVQQLKAMFPDLDASTIQSVLQTKNDNLEQCIDALVAMTSTTLSTEETQRLRDEAFTTLVNKVMRMTSDSKAAKLVGNHGMSIQTVSWEDCARSKGSCWGPCISDMTLMVKDHALPVIRYPNFEDLTWDVEMDKIPLVVGNELQDQQLYTVSLTEYLQHMKLYLSKQDSWTGSKTSLHAAERDSHVIVSAQACFLPVPQSGDATFNVSLYNYQSYPGDPAVLAIVATAQGTSAQVVENGSQKLYFNKHGEKASFIGQRLSDARKEKQQKGEEPAKHLDAPMSKEEQQQNVIMIIQVPLKQKGSNRRGLFMMPSVDSASSVNCCLETACFEQAELCDVEDAMVSVGDSEGPFDEINGRAIERDERFPVRVTLQFYKATSNGVLDEEVVKTIASQIESSRKKADFVGSLVVGGKTNRPTEHNVHYSTPIPTPIITPPWWTPFWLTYGSSLGDMTESEAKNVLFQGGRYANSSLTDVKEQVLSTLRSHQKNGSKNLPYISSWGLPLGE